MGTSWDSDYAAEAKHQLVHSLVSGQAWPVASVAAKSLNPKP